MAKVDKEGHIIIKRSTHQEDITIVYSYVPNIRALKCIKQKTNRAKKRNSNKYYLRTLIPHPQQGIE